MVVAVALSGGSDPSEGGGTLLGHGERDVEVLDLLCIHPTHGWDRSRSSSGSSWDLLSPGLRTAMSPG